MLAEFMLLAAVHSHAIPIADNIPYEPAESSANCIPKTMLGS